MTVLPLNVLVTLAVPRWKSAAVRFVQRWMVNPPVRWLLHLGVMPLGYALLETRGRTSGKPRRTPVGKGMIGGTFWLVAEHGMRAGYVRNIERDPHVRLRMRIGLRFRWVEGIASLHPELDPARVQGRLARWHPLRAFNAMQVQVLGSTLLVVRIDLPAAGWNGASTSFRSVPAT
ncbi:nitroreductase family deazaflavin-dependent oxidoreductase [Leekyejoonella antrihumi]|uniref:Nitroreductase family deazaflavin-dependent oxidoreductase n=2 Tax=Leekyejoonella antrihumi TaxID=1660198 RepID=A0A563DWT9_9MICO|nr:nitroreductase family deazaflavin-dependent oxidoreductase [Leekyejoonella antrihumi]